MAAPTESSKVNPAVESPLTGTTPRTGIEGPNTQGSDEVTLNNDKAQPPGPRQPLGVGAPQSDNEPTRGPRPDEKMPRVPVPAASPTLDRKKVTGNASSQNKSAEIGTATEPMPAKLTAGAVPGQQRAEIPDPDPPGVEQPGQHGQFHRQTAPTRVQMQETDSAHPTFSDEHKATVSVTEYTNMAAEIDVFDGSSASQTAPDAEQTDLPALASAGDPPRPETPATRTAGGGTSNVQKGIASTNVDFGQGPPELPTENTAGPDGDEPIRFYPPGLKDGIVSASNQEKVALMEKADRYLKDVLTPQFSEVPEGQLPTISEETSEGRRDVVAAFIQEEVDEIKAVRQVIEKHIIPMGSEASGPEETRGLFPTEHRYRNTPSLSNRTDSVFRILQYAKTANDALEAAGDNPESYYREETIAALRAVATLPKKLHRQTPPEQHASPEPTEPNPSSKMNPDRKETPTSRINAEVSGDNPGALLFPPVHRERIKAIDDARANALEGISDAEQITWIHNFFDPQIRQADLDALHYIKEELIGPYSAAVPDQGTQTTQEISGQTENIFAQYTPDEIAAIEDARTALRVLGRKRNEPLPVRVNEVNEQARNRFPRSRSSQKHPAPTLTDRRMSMLGILLTAQAAVKALYPFERSQQTIPEGEITVALNILAQLPGRLNKSTPETPPEQQQTVLETGSNIDEGEEDNKPQFTLRGNEIALARERISISAHEVEILQALMSTDQPMSAHELASVMGAISSRPLGKYTNKLARTLADRFGTQVILISEPTSHKDPPTYQLNPACRYKVLSQEKAAPERKVSPYSQKFSGVPQRFSQERPGGEKELQIKTDNTLADAQGHKLRFTTGEAGSNILFVFNILLAREEPLTIDQIRSTPGFETAAPDPLRSCREAIKKLRRGLSRFDGDFEFVQRIETQEGAKKIIRFALNQAVRFVDERKEFEAQKRTAETLRSAKRVAARRAAVETRQRVPRARRPEQPAEPAVIQPTREELIAAQKAFVAKTFNEITLVGRALKEDHPKMGPSLDESVAASFEHPKPVDIVRDFLVIDSVAQALGIDLSPQRYPEVRDVDKYRKAVFRDINYAIRRAHLSITQKLIFGMHLGLSPSIKTYDSFMVPNRRTGRTQAYNAYYNWTQQPENGRDFQSIIDGLFRKNSIDQLQARFDEAVEKVKTQIPSQN